MTATLAALAVLCYVILTATQGVCLGSLVQRNVWHPIVLMTATFSAVVLALNVAQLCRNSEYLRSLRTRWREVLWLNVITTANFLTYFLAIRTLPVSSHAAIALGLGPLIILLVDQKQQLGRLNRFALIAGLGLVASLSCLAVALVGHASSFDITMSFVCGVSLVLTLFSQRRLKDHGWTSWQMMSARFFLLVAVGIAMCPALPSPSIPFQVAATHVAVLAVVGTIIPLFLLTWGQCHTRPMTSTILLYAMPLLMVAGELIEARISMSPTALAGVVGTCGFLVFGYLAK